MKVDDLKKLPTGKEASGYQSPILTVAFYVWGVITLSGGIVAAVFMESGINRFYAVFAAVGVSGWLFGIGQILDRIGQAAYHAGRAADQQALILYELRQIIQRVQ
jgi:hypothetical protein